MKLPVKAAPKTEAQIIAGERLRILSIVESAEGQRAPKSAFKLAVNSNLSVAMAVDMLKGFPAENPFMEAMQSEGPMGLGGNFASADKFVSGDPKELRKAELALAATAHNASRGYNAPGAK